MSSQLLQADSATIIIPQRGRSDLTIAALRGIRELHPQTPMIVIDDGSPPQELRRVQSARIAGVEIIAQPPRGVTHAWNAGARAAIAAGRDGFEHSFVFLNNDVESLAPWLDELLAPLNNGRLLSGVRLRHEAELGGQFVFLEGWCLACRATDWQVLDGFDDRMTLYFSDTDFQLRLLQDSGLSAEAAWGVCPNLPLQHYGAETSSVTPDRLARWEADRAVFLAKHGAGRSGSPHIPHPDFKVGSL